MSKAEEAAQDLGYGKDPLNRVEYTANDVWDACIDGYQQAEKDFELTWKDMEQIYNICCEVFLDYEVTRTNMQKIWKEVLKRFKDLKKCI